MELRELAQFAAAVGRGGGPLGPGTVVNNRGVFIERNSRENKGFFFFLFYSDVANFSKM